MASGSKVPATIPASGGEAGLNRYLTEIKKFPILAPEEEYMLAKRWTEHQDTDAAAKLVNSHLRLVAKIAMGYRGYGLPVSELISEGNIGLMQGVKKFEPERGFRLATYAMWWIRASIQEFILRSWSLVKMGTTAAQKKLFFNLRRMKNRIEAFEDGDMKPEDVAKIAMGYRGYGLPVSELISEGNIGLMQGVKKFEPERGFRLATYAMWWIRASIQEFILRSWSLVKMGTTAAQKKLFFNLRRMKNQIEAFEDGDLKPEDVTKIATDLGVSEEDVISMNRRMAMGGDTSLNVPLREEGDGQWQDWLVDTDPLQDERVAEAQETAVRHELLVEAMKALNDREKHILTERRLVDEPKTLEELSQVYDVSRERIRQIEVRAFEKLQKALMGLAGERRLLTAG